MIPSICRTWKETSDLSDLGRGFINTVHGVTYLNKTHTNEDVDGRASPTIIINQLQGESLDPNHSISEK